MSITQQESKPIEFLEKLGNFSEQNLTGELIVQNPSFAGRFILISGNLLYVKDNYHRVRRWQRAIQQYSPKFNLNPDNIAEQAPWECQIIHQGMSEQKLSYLQARCIIRKIVEECFFYIVDDIHSLKIRQGDTNIHRHFYNHDENSLDPFKGLTISFGEFKKLLVQAAKLRQDWVKNHLQEINPDLAPKLKIEEELYLKMYEKRHLPIPLKYLHGTHNIWDIAQEMHKSIIEIGEALQHLNQQKIISLHKISDLAVLRPNNVPTNPVHVLKKVPPANLDISGNHKSFTPNYDTKGKLIACIDDSQVVIHGLKKILLPAGYRVLPITEPMAGFGQMILYKPDMILLDINMPHADGYSVCQFLHRTTLFKHTPIIILSGRDGELDKAHAKRVGAVAFINKPPKEEDLLALILEHLSKENQYKKQENLSEQLRDELSHYSTPKLSAL